MEPAYKVKIINIADTLTQITKKTSL